ncbi:sushi, von Willebrand factor type A, EGF and pentraxin domain-containing protein 1 [Nematostella vectensis]|uniref:sushi, von Willebrand factor type A, EGF and pentraxin domain-containing protein 1 n=1 Tax=Nematostella vectensis TaxID=45351 RepID=UPI0020778EF2|nr:sushi, von Willebrand factor type A, EGF and pentraxin domain-containing protein 1 [Nematostella vectensis]
MEKLSKPMNSEVILQGLTFGIESFPVRSSIGCPWGLGLRVVGDVIAWPNMREAATGQVKVWEKPEIAMNARDNDFELDFIGPASILDYVKFTTNDSKILALTIFLWVKTESTVDQLALMSYATDTEPNSLLLIHERSSSILKFSLMGKDYNFDAVAFLRDGNWHSIGASWESSSGRLKAFVDGNQIKDQDAFQLGKEIPGQGLLILGQEQDSYGGGFHATQVFTGCISHVDIWKSVLEPEIIQSMSRGCGAWSGSVISWRAIRNAPRFGNIQLREHSACTIPGFTAQMKRDAKCNEEFGGNKDCKSPLYAIFDKHASHYGKMWRCYNENALKNSAYYYGKEYDGISTCYYTRHVMLSNIID